MAEEPSNSELVRLAEENARRETRIILAVFGAVAVALGTGILGFLIRMPGSITP